MRLAPTENEADMAGIGTQPGGQCHGMCSCCGHACLPWQGGQVQLVPQSRQLLLQGPWAAGVPVFVEHADVGRPKGLFRPYQGPRKHLCRDPGYNVGQREGSSAAFGVASSPVRGTAGETCPSQGQMTNEREMRGSACLHDAQGKQGGATSSAKPAEIAQHTRMQHKDPVRNTAQAGLGKLDSRCSTSGCFQGVQERPLGCHASSPRTFRAVVTCPCTPYLKRLRQACRQQLLPAQTSSMRG